MFIEVEGINMSVGEVLTKFVEDKLQKNIGKYFADAVTVEVKFTKETKGHAYTVVIAVNEGSKTGIVIKSNATETDHRAAFEKAAHKVEAQLRKYKGRLTSYRSKQKEKLEKEMSSLMEAQKYTLPQTPYVAEGEEPKEEEVGISIIAEKQHHIEELTVDEAIMKMDLADLPTLMFVNKDNGRINVVYHRKDGFIAWIDPKNGK